MQELQIWLRLPDDSLFALMRAKAAATGNEWSISTWNVVTGYLRKIFESTLDQTSLTTYQTVSADDGTIDADYQDWNDNHNLDPLFIFDKSAQYPDPTIDAALYKKYARGVRLSYLARIYGKAIENM